MTIMSITRDGLHAAVRDATITYVGLQVILFLTVSFLLLGVIILFIDNAEWLYRKINHCLHPPVIITGEEEISGEEQADTPTKPDETTVDCHVSVSGNTLNKV